MVTGPDTLLGTQSPSCPSFVLNIVHMSPNQSDTRCLPRPYEEEMGNRVTVQGWKRPFKALHLIVGRHGHTARHVIECQKLLATS